MIVVIEVSEASNFSRVLFSGFGNEHDMQKVYKIS